MRDYELCVDYRDNDRLRAGFNELAGRVFGLDFESWYQNGFWKENYIPYSLLHMDRVVANISVNHMEFNFNGEKRSYIQLGTVMTDEAYRRKGLGRVLMEEIIRIYKDTAKGVYLFANDSVLDFYPRFGFRKGKEYCYVRNVQNIGPCTAVPVRMEGKEDLDKLIAVMRKSICNSSLEMIHNEGLIMFYASGYLKGNVYYIEDQEAYVIAEKDERSNLFIHTVFSDKIVNLGKLVQAFGEDVCHVRLGFTPLDTGGFQCVEEFHADTTLFILGQGFEEFEKNKLMFPTLSHA